MSNYIMKQWDYSNLKKNIKIVFLSAEFNRNYTEHMENVNEAFLKKNGFENIEKFMVPGAYEIPWFLKEIVKNKKADLIICFWVVIRWETTHYEMVSNESARWIMDIILKNYNKSSIINWILTCENKKQVEARIDINFALSGLNLLSEKVKLNKG